MDQAQLDALRAQHGRIATADTPAGLLVFRKPTRAEYKKFQRLARDPEQNDIADEVLAGDTIVSHTREEFIKMLDEFPGLLSGPEINRALKAAAGIIKVEEGKG